MDETHRMRVKITLPPKPIVVGRQLWMVREDCDSLVRVNKPLIGSLHLCQSGEDEEDE